MGQVNIQNAESYKSVPTEEGQTLADVLDDFFAGSTPDLSTLAIRLNGVVVTSDPDDVPVRDQDSVLVVTKQLNRGGIKGA